MSQNWPELADYVHLFQLYGADLSEMYLDDDADRYALLFEQVVGLLTAPPSPFNLSLPEPFRITAQRYREGHPATLAHLADAGNRNFMLSDLYDLVMLKGGLDLKRHEVRP
ncbi:hypothetical protein [Bradyrhizobium sp. WD16]|uniref:hypothetical protein n=1 Tax=Bradyrhizobium sp. WD16 TaxID=1521768 RepID=UPI0020A27926|nr:hypothetical protein [Bradyrhizobium sp. WD16]UTD29674.1 hypothetical protein DB459_24980 [Bradyrhizobium sp. WD16]